MGLFIDSYRLGARLGGGGQAMVYEAEHEHGGRFAVKVLSGEYTEQDMARMRTEWRALTGVRHPNVVQAHQSGTTNDGRPYIAMDRLDGETLARRLARAGKLSVNEAVSVARQVLAGLATVHRAGIVHRDVKPANVFLTTDGRAVLIDFGIAKFRNGVATVTSENVVVGSPRYMAPEQASGDAVDARTDIYAVGLLLFEMLTGDPPFGRMGDTEETFRAHAEDEPPRLRVAAAIDAVVASALAKDPAARPQSAEAFASRLELATAPRRWRWAIGAAAAASLGIAALAWHPRQTTAAPPPARTAWQAEPPPHTEPQASSVSPSPLERSAGAARGKRRGPHDDRTSTDISVGRTQTGDDFSVPMK